MYDREAIQECLCSLVGWYQTNNPDYPQLDSGLLVSDSDLYFQDGHALIDIENIDQAFKNYDHYNFPNWDVGTTYNTDDRVRNPSDNLIYKSLIDNNLGNQPDLSPNEWEEVNLLSIALKQQMQSSVNEILNNAFLMKKFDKNVKALFQNTRLFDWTRSVKDKVVKKGRFVGLEIVPRRDINLAVVLQKIGTDFDTLNPNLTIYVYHSSQEAPIDTLTINHNKVNSHVWTILTDKVLTYMADTHDAGGSFYIGYYEDDLLGQAIEKTNIDFRLGPCRTCSSRTWTMWNTWSQYLSVTPFSVSSQNLNGTNLWDVDDNNQDWCTNFGLNLELTVKCDLTSVICNQATIFAEAYQKHVSLKLIERMAYTTRNNYIAAKNEEAIQTVKLDSHFAIQNKDNNTDGLALEVKKLIKGIDIDLSNLNTVCMPCRQSKGIKKSTA